MPSISKRTTVVPRAFSALRLIILCTGIITTVSAESVYYETSDVSTVDIILANVVKIKHSREEFLHSERLPFICVSYAQTLDGHIARVNKNKETSSNLKLSSKESFLLTHALRSEFDGILIGGKTLEADNPRMSNRLWSERHEFEDGKVVMKRNFADLQQPIPIILDTNLRHLMGMVDSSQMVNAAMNHKLVIVCCSQEAFEKHRKRIESYCISNNLPIELLPSELNEATPALDIEDIARKLHRIHGIRSIMVEGGASVISGLFSHHRELVHCLCVTICPKIIGSSGLNAFGSAYIGSNMEFDESNCFKLGRDCIFLAS